MESSSTIEIYYAAQNLSDVIPNIHKLLFLVVDVTFEIQEDHGDFNLKNVQT